MTSLDVMCCGFTRLLHYIQENNPYQDGNLSHCCWPIVESSVGMVYIDYIRVALHLEAGPISLEADCTKFQPFLDWRPASTTH
jgi:hypothetical protein